MSNQKLLSVAFCAFKTWQTNQQKLLHIILKQKSMSIYKLTSGVPLNE